MTLRRTCAITLTVLVALAAASFIRAEIDQRAALVALRELMRPPDVLRLAESARVTECLRQHGFAYTGPLRSYDSRRETQTLAGVGVVLTIEDARTDGYGDLMIEESQTVDTEVTPLETYIDDLSNADRLRFEALTESPKSPQATYLMPQGFAVSAPTRGCVAAARVAIYGSVDAFLLVHHLPQEVLQFADIALATPDVETSLDDYGQCMHDEGYLVDYPEDSLAAAKESFGPRSAHERPSGDEIAMATTDARCQADSRLNKVIDSAMHSATEPWIVQNVGRILSTYALSIEATERAKEVLAGTGLNTTPEA